jgi:hypothetical protein
VSAGCAKARGVAWGVCANCKGRCASHRDACAVCRKLAPTAPPKRRAYDASPRPPTPKARRVGADGWPAWLPDGPAYAGLRAVYARHRAGGHDAE